jgi:hypothetical protein
MRNSDEHLALFNKTSLFKGRAANDEKMVGTKVYFMVKTNPLLLV